MPGAKFVCPLTKESIAEYGLRCHICDKAKGTMGKLLMHFYNQHGVAFSEMVGSYVYDEWLKTRHKVKCAMSDLEAEHVQPVEGQDALHFWMCIYAHVFARLGVEFVSHVHIHRCDRSAIVMLCMVRRFTNVCCVHMKQQSNAQLV